MWQALYLLIIECIMITELLKENCNGGGIASGCQVPSPRQQGTEQKYVIVSLIGCHRQCQTPGSTHPTNPRQYYKRYVIHMGHLLWCGKLTDLVQFYWVPYFFLYHTEARGTVKLMSWVIWFLARKNTTLRKQSSNPRKVG